MVKNSQSSSAAFSLKPGEALALVTSYRLGDSLLAMILVHHLTRAGYQVGVFSQAVYALREWFPGVTVYPFEALENEGRKYLHLWYERPNRKVPRRPDPQSGEVVFLNRTPWYQRPVSMAEVYLSLCREGLGISAFSPENGLQVPQGVSGDKDLKKVILHPTSSSRLKNWPLSSFLALARMLRNEGYEVECILAPEEKGKAERIKEKGLACFVRADLSRVAERLRQAGWFIGNDSGLGQLASNVGTPTLILFPLPRRAARWLPCWAPARAVWPALPERVPEIFRHLLWKYAIKPETVHSAFKDFVREVAGSKKGVRPS
jgi:heptosyltransferase-3